MSSDETAAHSATSPLRQEQERERQHKQTDPLLVFDEAVTLSDPDTIHNAPSANTLVTPRTQHVFRQLGILSVAQLKDPVREHVVAEMRKHHVDRNLVHDKSVVERRYKFKVEIQKKLLTQALRAYSMVLAQEEEDAKHHQHPQKQHSSSPTTHSAPAGKVEGASSSLLRAQYPSFSMMNQSTLSITSLNANSTNRSEQQQRAPTPNAAGAAGRSGRASSAAGRPGSAAAGGSSASRRHLHAIHHSTATPSASASKQSANKRNYFQLSGDSEGDENRQREHEQQPHFIHFQADLEDEDDLAEVLRNAEHIKHANMKRLEQILLKREIVRFKHDKMRDDHEQQEAVQKEKEAKLRASERKAAQEQMALQIAREAESRRQREERQREMMERREEFEARTRELDTRWNARRRRAMEENRKRAELNSRRREAQMAQAQESEQRKRQVQEQSQLISEVLLARRRQDQAGMLHSTLDTAAEQARYRLAEVRARGEALTEARLARLKEKEEAELRIAQEQEQARRGEVEAKRAAEEAKAEQRRRALLIAARNADKQREKVLEAVGVYEARAERQQLARGHEHLMRQERMREVELAHDLFKTRQSAAMAAKRDDLEATVLEKNVRVAALAQRRENRRLRRLLIRQEAEKTHIATPDELPGPGEYEVASAFAVGTEGPRFTFGIPFSAQGARQIDKNTPCANYLASPGPASYTPKVKIVKPHRQTAVLSRSDRWTLRQAEFRRVAALPGPGAYFSPHRLDDIDDATLERTLRGDSVPAAVDKNLSWSA